MARLNLKDNLWVVLLVIGTLAVAEPSPPASVATKMVEMEWEPVDDAGAYEIRITPIAGDAKSRHFTATESHLTTDLPLGTYQLQIRSKSKDGETFSPWSESMTLEVAFKEIVPLSPEDGSVINAVGHDAGKQEVLFKWTPVDKVKIYTLRVWSNDKQNTPWVFTGTHTEKRLAMPPGLEYHWQVTFESASSTSYAQEPKTFSFTVQGHQLDKPILVKPATTHVQKLNWKVVPEAMAYELRLHYRHLDETIWTLLKTEHVIGVEWSTTGNLKPGAYKVEVTATSTQHAPSPTATLEFVVKPSAVDLEQTLRQAGL